jgi:hypothetical protein
MKAEEGSTSTILLFDALSDALSTQSPVHALGDVFEQSRHRTSVKIGRQGDLRVTENLLQPEEIATVAE